jgi:hypothetical protein
MDTVRKRHWWNFERRIMNNMFTLEQWIVAATKNLTPTAIASITREITDHYQTSLEKYEARGISSIEAESLAVRDLGDPEKSANKFVQVYLTKKEELRITEMMAIPHITKVSCQIIMAFLVLLLYYPLFSTAFGIFNYNMKLSLNSIFYTLMVVIFILSSICDFFIIKMLKNKLKNLLFAKLKLFFIIFLVFSALIYAINSTMLWGFRFYVCYYLALAIYSTIWVRYTYPILRKFANTPQRAPSI